MCTWLRSEEEMESKMKVGLQKLTVAVLSALVFLSLVPVLSESVFAGNHKIDEAFVGMPIKAETGCVRRARSPKTYRPPETK